MLRLAASRQPIARWSKAESFLRLCRNASSKQQPAKAKPEAKSPNAKPEATADGIWTRYAAKLRGTAQIAALGLAIFLLLHIETTYFYAFDMTYGVSMMPTIHASGDSVIISKLYRRGRNVKVGDVISFDHPVDQDIQSIKRVVGLEGDWVARDTPGVGRGIVIQVRDGAATSFKRD